MPIQLGNRFLSSGLTMSYFPLRASLEQLTRFCDEYLNFAGTTSPLPDEAGRFSPRFPVVYMILADHPHLKSLDDGTVLVQRELAFSIPVEHQRKDRGRVRSSGFGWTQPFIYIDSPLGLTTGRQVWGWPKAMASFDSSTWTERGGKVTVNLSQLDGPLVEVRRDAGAEARPGMGLVGALDVWRSMTSGYASALGDLYDYWGGLGRTDRSRQAQDSPGLKDALDCVQQLWRQLARWPDFELPIITLKQFRYFQDPELACYQAIVRSLSRFSRPRARLLGPDRQMLGDLSGGLRVDIHAHALQPVVERLGLEPDDRTTGIGGHGIATFKPLMPFEVTFDASYDAGEVLAWRQAFGPWYAPHAAPEQAPRAFDARYVGPGRNHHNDARRGATQASSAVIAGTTVQLDIYPLPVAENRIDDLKKLVRHYLFGAAPGSTVELTEQFVYLAVTRSPAFGSLVSFCVPVTVRHGADCRQGWFIPLEYAEEGRLAITRTESGGQRTMPASLAWTERGPERLRELSAEIVPNRKLGGEARVRSLLRVEYLTTPAEAAPKPLLGTQMTDHYTSFIWSLQQFPDARFAGHACVQALIEAEISLTEISERERMKERVEVGFVAYESQSIVELLGLRRLEGDRVLAQDPFSLRATLSSHRTERLPSSFNSG
jgi:hypothetical protein